MFIILIKIMRILLVNDDGYSSPALIPTIEVLERLGEVTTVVPYNQQSWTSKSNTRHLVSIKRRDLNIEGRKIITLDGTPADCANYGLFLDSEFPDILISGANVGHNTGLAAFFSSGTVGAALEGLLLGIPSISVSIPYTFGDELTSDAFKPPLEILPKIVQKFLNNLSYDINMLMLNLPLNIYVNELIAVDVAKHAFGKLFETDGNNVKPIFYPKLIQPDDSIKFTDAWAKVNKLASVVGLDSMGQFISRVKIARWLIENDLSSSPSNHR